MDPQPVAVDRGRPAVGAAPGRDGLPRRSGSNRSTVVLDLSRPSRAPASRSKRSTCLAREAGPAAGQGPGHTPGGVGQDRSISGRSGRRGQSSAVQEGPQPGAFRNPNGFRNPDGASACCARTEDPGDVPDHRRPKKLRRRGDQDRRRPDHDRHGRDLGPSKLLPAWPSAGPRPAPHRDIRRTPHSPEHPPAGKAQAAGKAPGKQAGRPCEAQDQARLSPKRGTTSAHP